MSKPAQRFSVAHTRRGFRLHQADAILSEVVNRPGPTDDVFDLLAACIATLAPGSRVAVLGFAAGGLIAPLFAMGWRQPIDVVDLDRRGYELFHGHAEFDASWVRFHEAEARDWLARQRPFDLIVDDLSVVDGDTVTKPVLSYTALPALVRARLRPGGMVATNLLSVPGLPWTQLLAAVGAPWPEPVQIRLAGWENQVLLGGFAMPPARQVSLRLRRCLAGIQSDIADKISSRRQTSLPGTS